LAHASEIGSTVAHPAALDAAFHTGQLAVGAGSGLALVVASACYAWAGGGGRTVYPRWAVAFTPLLVYPLPPLLRAGPGIDLFLAPTAFSVTSAVFFAGSTILLWDGPVEVPSLIR